MSLVGLKVIEFAGLAPGPFAGLILADNGASVTRIDRPSSVSSDILCRGKRSLAINTKISSGREVVKKLIAQADVVIDPFRPGVLERLGLGPEVFLGSKNNGGINENLIYARIVGFSRTGPHNDMAGHDINYLALSGVLSMLSTTSNRPNFPLNLLGDFAGGGLTCALGILLALVERGISGRGQVVEADMVSGTRYLASFPLMHMLAPNSQLFAGAKVLAGGAPFYAVYECKGGGFMSLGCLEPDFFKIFVESFVPEVKKLGGKMNWSPSPETQMDISHWPRMKDFFEKGFMLQDRDHWGHLFHGTDACAVPILTPAEACELDQSKSPLPIPHPNLSRTPADSLRSVSDTKLNISASLYLEPGQDNNAILRELSLSNEDIKLLIREGALDRHPDAKL